MQVQGLFAPSANQTYNLMESIPAGATLTISDITVTCDVCSGFGYAPGGGTYFPNVLVNVFSGDLPDCTTTGGDLKTFA